MIFKLKIGRWKIVFTLAPVTKVIGVNSTLPDGNHILMWDFDNQTLQTVIESLTFVQLLENLPIIYILETKVNRNYIAYCFARCKWMEAVRIIAETPFICYKHFKWGVYRKYFTLRITEKQGKKPRLVYKIFSDTPETVRISELSSFVQYEIFDPEWNQKVITIGLAKTHR